MNLQIKLTDNGGVITGDRESLLIVIEGARRDLNACAQAAGGSPEWRQKYAKLAAEIAALSAHVPRVNLFAAEPLAERPKPAPVSTFAGLLE